ncbi:IS3 family transposase [Streptococcus dentapri]|uniref:IS3 family transposase n=1 Tax=Streptococcus dentapri TaxID=573564 RepID=A0ABV8D1T4_9STRE
MGWDDILKFEIFYGCDKAYKTLDELEQAITDYFFVTITHVLKQKRLSPVQYRTKSFH